LPHNLTILAFDTSAAHCAAALLRGGGIVAGRRETMAKGQAERLFPLLEDVLAEAATEWDALDAVAVGAGPGNFTGIRIAVSAARGLALSLGIPAVGVSCLEAQAEGLGRPVVSSLTAPRRQVWAEVLGPPGSPPALMDPGAINLDISPRAEVRCVGAFAEVIALQLAGRAVDPAMPLAEGIARIAARRISAGVPLPRPVPLYLRSADALPATDPPPVILP